MFSYQQNFFNPTREVTPEQFWALVGAPFTEECITKFRETGDAAWKKRLPAFIFQATFDVTKSKKGYEGAWRKQAATRLTGLVVMDVDHVENPEMKFDEWVLSNGNIFEDEGILLVYVTPSGHGLKVVFKARTAWGNLIDNQLQMAKILGVEVDEACKDASRMSFICAKDDILFINETELFDYENKEFSEKWSETYRGGHSGATQSVNKPTAGGGGGAAGDDLRVDAPGDGVGQQADTPLYRGVAYRDIINTWLGGREPQAGDRHNTLLKLATDLRYICDNSARLMRQVLLQEPWVQALADEGDSVDTVIKSAQDYRMYQTVPKRLREVLAKAGVPADADAADADTATATTDQLPLREWGEAIGRLADSYPCLHEAAKGLAVECRPAVMFTAAAFLGTLLTRCTYRFYHRPEELRRLNYCVFIIGDPASGKSFATRLYKLLAAPIKTADKVGYDAINKWKEEMRQKGANKEKPKRPQVVIRDHPARTSNAQFITDMNAAVETVDGQPMHLHMLTFDTELDNSTLTQRGGSWIDKTTMELKSFHNEEDGQAYSNLDSVSGTFNVYWNFVYTGTPLSLSRKVTERNFGSGLGTRLAVVPLPPSGYKMMELKQTTRIDHQADETLKTWAYRLDGVKGELPLWPLVERCWQWTNDRMEEAAFNDDRASELLLKRVSYYGIAVATPYILMRHWDEWQQHHTLTIDDTDLELTTLALDIQHRCQHHFFERMARAYFDDQTRDQAVNRRRPSRYDDCYAQLPKQFTADDVARVYAVAKGAASTTCTRLTRAGVVERIKKGLYRKLKNTLQ